MDLNFFNPFGDRFLTRNTDRSRRRDITTVKNSQGLSEDDLIFNQQNIQGDYTSNPINFNQNIPDKKSRIMKYREMELFVEINEALDYITDDAILEDDNGEIVTLDLKKDLPHVVEIQLREEFDYITDDVLQVRDNLWDLFRKWLVEAELYLEIIKDDTKTRVVGVKPLASFSTFPVYTGNFISGFTQNQNIQVNSTLAPVSTNQKDSQIVFDYDQVAYINWGKYGTSKWDVRGFLEPAIRTYNQLKNLEDSIVVYRLARSSEKRIWNIAMGKMPAGKKEENLRKLIQKYRKQLNYNSETGSIDSTAHIQALSEDIWFATGENGETSSVTTLPAGMNLGELEDLKYFLSKLYKVMKLPKNRFEDNNSVYSSGKSIEREEVRFGKFIDRLQNKFKKIIIDVYMTHLKALGTIDEKYIDPSIIDVKLTKANFFKEFKEAELIQNNVDLWNSINSFVVSKADPDAAFSKEFVWKNILRMSDESWHLNNNLIKKEQEAIKASEEAPVEDTPPEEPTKDTPKEEPK